MAGMDARLAVRQCQVVSVATALHHTLAQAWHVFLTFSTWTAMPKMDANGVAQLCSEVYAPRVHKSTIVLLWPVTYSVSMIMVWLSTDVRQGAPSLDRLPAWNAHHQRNAPGPTVLLAGAMPMGTCLMVVKLLFNVCRVVEVCAAAALRIIRSTEIKTATYSAQVALPDFMLLLTLCQAVDLAVACQIPV